MRDTLQQNVCNTVRIKRSMDPQNGIMPTVSEHHRARAIRSLFEVCAIWSGVDQTWGSLR
jgi:hypothetical protein